MVNLSLTTPLSNVNPEQMDVLHCELHQILFFMPDGGSWTPASAISSNASLIACNISVLLNHVEGFVWMDKAWGVCVCELHSDDLCTDLHTQLL